MVDKEQAKEKVRALVEKFEKRKEYYLSKDYNESQARLDFIDLLFEALGWDIRNEKGLPPQDREVVVEQGGETRGRPDYSFRIGNRTKFFVEAKAPRVPLNTKKHILQAKSYAWSKEGKRKNEAYFVVLTDFEDLILFDATLKPNPRDPTQGQVWKISYDKYLDRFEDLWKLSRDAAEAGELDALLLKDPESRRQRKPVDEAFLEELQGWREALAKDLYKQAPKHPELREVRLLNEVVQRMLDRLVFIHIAEDRGVLERGKLQRVADIYRSSGKPVSGLLNVLFKEVNEKLNGEIFKPGHAVEQYEFDSGLLQRLIEGLYSEDSSYRFDVIPVELLGTIYERYLGTAIHLTEKRVKVQEKPEVRKAGGVFYTPRYIVDYIVENTVGRLIEGKSPDEVAKLRILDPACGSGSFLLGAYQKLIDHHIRYYQAHPEQATGRFIANGGGQPRLTIEEKGRILKNNIHGVDIDPQAVEITMMSLYIKALEGERAPPGGREVLPRLAENVRCGNSLIGHDIYDTSGKTFTEEERTRINAFDWNSKAAGFGGILEGGGFDAVIGNPPYVRQETISGDKLYFQSKYAVFAGTADLYAYFIEKAIRLLKGGGIFSFIVSNKFLRAAYGEKLRKFIPNQTRVHRFIDFGDLPVFEGATVYPCILVVEKEPDAGKKEVNQVKVCNAKTLEFKNLAHYVESNEFLVPQKSLLGGEWHLQGGETIGLIQKICSAGSSLAEYCGREPLFGVKTGLNEVFIVDEEQIKKITKGSKKELDIFIPYLRGRNVKRYNYEPTGQYLLFTDGITEKDHPNVMSYLREHKTALEARVDIRGKNKEWYELRPWRYYDLLKKPKIIYPDIANRNSFTLDEKGMFVSNTCYFIPSTDKYLLGLLNSQLLFFYFVNITAKQRGGYFRYMTEYVSHLPIRPISPSNPSDKSAHDEIVRLVDRMLDLHKKRAALPASSERERVEREIAATDERIDEIVYRLYGITGEERRIIEGKA